MSLVSYLKALCSRFYSKNESELVGHQAMPGDSTIEYFNGDHDVGWSCVHSFIAPTDGYVSCNANSTAEDSVVTIKSNQLPDNLTFPWVNSSIGTQVPIKKGAQVTVYAARVKGVIVGFVKTIGGG